MAKWLPTLNSVKSEKLTGMSYLLPKLQTESLVLTPSFKILLRLAGKPFLIIVQY